MIDLFGSAIPGDSAALVVAFDVALKSTTLIVLAWAAHALVGRRRALVRSALWNSCVVGLLVVPATSLLFPRLRIVVTVARENARVEAATLTGNVSPTENARLMETPVVLLRPVPSAGPTESREPALVRPAAMPVTGPKLSSRPRAAGLLIGVYLAMAALLALKLAASLAAVGRLMRRCEPIENPAWGRALARWQTRLGVASRVALLSSDRVSVPIVVGWLRPAIIVPGALADTSGREVITAVIVHELGHVKRGDWAWNLARKLVQILYWPHPLIWPVGRIVAAVREQACDDLCVHVLGGAASYRASLVEVASCLVRRPDPALGMAMARPTNLGRRLAWIDRSRGAPRCLMGWPGRLALGAMVVMFAGALGVLELARKEVEASDEPPARLVDRAFDAPVAAPPAIEIVVMGKDTNKPLMGARVLAHTDFVETLWNTDREGRIRVDLSKLVFADRFGFDVWADGYVQQRHYFGTYYAQIPTIPERITVSLLPGEETLGGKVTNEDGRPIAGARVVLWGYLGEKKESHEAAFMVDTMTDPNGEWRCRSCRKMTFAYIYLSHPDYVADEQSQPRTHGQPQEGKPYSPDDPALKGLRAFSDVQVMKRGVAIVGRVTDQKGNAVADAEVGRLLAHHLDTFSWEMPRTRTDRDGRFACPHVQPGKYALQVKARGHAPELKLVTAAQKSEPVSIALAPPRVLSGRFVDTQGKPIAGAYVYMSGWRGSWALGVNLKTDADGRFRWEDAPDDSVQIDAGREGYDGVYRLDVVAGEDGLNLTFKRTLTISGRLTDEATGKPIDGGSVEVGVSDLNGGPTTWSPQEGANAFKGSFQASLDAKRRPEYRLRLKARGYEPFETRAFRSDEKKVKYDVTLTKSGKPQGVAVSGFVRRTDGRPLEGADVTITYPSGGVPAPSAQIENGRIGPSQGQTIVKTDAQGRFTLTREPDPAGQYFAVVVVHPEFYAEAPRSVFEADSTISARPWGRVEGVVRSRNSPAASESVVRYSGDRLGNSDVPTVWESGHTTPDGDRRFAFDRVIPGDARVYLSEKQKTGIQAATSSVLVVVRSGETTRAELGGRGRPVIAQVVAPAGFDPKADYSVYSQFEIQSDRPRIPYPKELLAKRDASMTTWAKAWWTSALGREYRRNYVDFGQAQLRPDGTIRVEDVPPGDYRLNLSFSAYPLRAFMGSNDRIAYTTKQFTVPEIKGGRSDAPLDLGILRPKLKETLKVGQPVPPFEVETLDGRRLRLEDFRGKYVLLDFWATWCGPCVAEIPELKELHERFGKDKRFAVLSLSLDADKEAPRKFVADRGIAWPQGLLGDPVAGGVQDLYHVEAIPAVFLIGPDGKLVSTGLRGAAIGAAVATALNAP